MESPVCEDSLPASPDAGHAPDSAQPPPPAHPDVLVAHAGQQPCLLVYHLHRGLLEVSSGLRVAVASCALPTALGDVREPVLAQESGAGLGVLVITENFVRSENCMGWLHRLLAAPSQASGCSGHYAQQPWTDRLGQRVVVVLDGLSVDQLKTSIRRYRSQAWWHPAPKPDDSVLVEWADDLLELTTALPPANIIQKAEWQKFRQASDLGVLRVLELLEAAGVTGWKDEHAAAQAAAESEWETEAERLVPDAPPPDAAAAIDQQATEPDAFLSHAGEQKREVVDVIHKEFRDKQPELRVYLDEKSVVRGSSSLASIGRACRTAAVGVLVLSKEFVRKEYCMAELSILLRRWRSGEVHLLPVLYGGLTVGDLSGMRSLYASQPWCVKGPMPAGKTLDAWAADLRELTKIGMLRCDQWRGYGELAEKVLADTFELLKAAGKLPNQASANLVLHSFVTPPPATKLVGRQEELQRALQALAEWRYVEILGGPGEGKSTLAQHAMQELCAQWQQLPKAEAAGKEAYALEVNLRGLEVADNLKNAVASLLLSMVSESAPAPTAWQVLLGWLRQQEVARVVVLCENAEEGVMMEGFQPLLNELRALHNVQLIVGTRVAGPAIQQVPREAAVVELQPLDEAAGMQLVEAHLGTGHAWGADGADEGAARQLVRLVEGNPLVLSVAAGLVRSTELTWKAVASKARQECAAITPRAARKPGGMKSYMAALPQWLCSCLAEEEQQALAAVSVFAGSFTAAGAAVVSGVEAVDSMHETLLALRDVSLVRQWTVEGVSSRAQGEGAQRYAMHALVREAASKLLTTDNKSQCLQRFVLWMLLRNEGPAQTLLQCEGPAPDVALLLYLLRVEVRNFTAASVGLPEVEAGAVEECVDAAGKVACVFAERGHGNAAQVLVQRAAEVAKRKLGTDCPATLRVQNKLANTLGLVGALGEARRLEEEVLEARTRVLGPEDPDTLSIKGNLAVTMRDAGELGEARRLEEEVLEARTRMLGPEHPDTLTTKGNLAVTMKHVKGLGEARRLEEEVLEARTRVLGAEHPDTLSTKGNLAVKMKDARELGEARRLEEEVLEAYTRVLGAEHPDTLRTKGNLAVTMKHAKELGEARRLEEEVLEARTRVLGAEHPDTLTAKGNLAVTLSDMGELGEARRLEEEVLEACTRVLGAEHPDTLRTKGNLAITFRVMGEVGEARRLEEEVLEARTTLQRSLGYTQRAVAQIGTLRTKGNLAITFRVMGELGEARRLEEEVLEVRMRVLGPEHPG